MAHIHANELPCDICDPPPVPPKVARDPELSRPLLDHVHRLVELIAEDVKKGFEAGKEAQLRAAPPVKTDIKIEHLIWGVCQARNAFGAKPPYDQLVIDLCTRTIELLRSLDAILKRGTMTQLDGKVYAQHWAFEDLTRELGLPSEQRA